MSLMMPITILPSVSLPAPDAAGLAEALALAPAEAAGLAEADAAPEAAGLAEAAADAAADGFAAAEAGAALDAGAAPPPQALARSMAPRPNAVSFALLCLMMTSLARMQICAILHHTPRCSSSSSSRLMTCSLSMVSTIAP